MSYKENQAPEGQDFFSWGRRLFALFSSFSFLILWCGGLIFFLPIFIWFFCRIEVESGEMAVLLKKTGQDLLSGQILADMPVQKGIQLDVLAEGRYFYNPYTWDWRIHKITDIPAGKLGVVTRLYGKDLSSGKIIAEAGTKGIVRNVLTPGKYRINPYAERIDVFDAINIRPGYVGVVTSLVGQDVLNDDISAEGRNTFLVSEDTKGVVPKVLDPGTYYLNPYVVSVTEVNLQSQRFEMSGSKALSFLTMDGFTVQAEGTIEFSLKRDQMSFLAHRVGDMDDVVKKVILPRARGFSRIEGSKNPAVNYIVGETRQQFEDKLEKHLRDNCESWGVTIHSVLIRNIIPPDEISSVIRDREVAVQNSKKFDQQIIQAQSKAELSKQEMLAQQSKEKVEAETIKILAIISAKKDQSVKIVAAQREQEVTKIENESANYKAEAMMSKAKAEQDVIALDNKAQAEVLATQVKAFGSGMNWARYHYYQKLAPMIRSILSNDEPGNLDQMFIPETRSEKGERR